MSEELLGAILEKVDPDELVDVLGLTTEELLDIPHIRFEVELKAERFDYLEVMDD